MSSLHTLDWLTGEEPQQSHQAHSHEESYQHNGLPMHDDVAKLAYELWEHRRHNGLDGTAESDWFEAERRLHPGERVPGE
jgi:hypothetical protein